MIVAVGSDHRGFAMKCKVVQILTELGHTILDCSGDDNEKVDYPEAAATVAKAILDGKAERGVLTDGTGHGMCIAANRFPGIRAIACGEEFTVELCRSQMDINVICFGETWGDGFLRRTLEKLIYVDFESSQPRHNRRVNQLDELYPTKFSLPTVDNQVEAELQ